MRISFVTIVAIGRKHVYVNFCFEDFINKAVLFRDCPAPLSAAVTFQLFRMSSASLGMLHQFVEQFYGFFMCNRFVVA